MNKLLILLPLTCKAFLSIGERPSSITRSSTVALYSSRFQKDQKDASKHEILEKSLKDGFDDFLEEEGAQSFPSINLDSEVNASRVVGPKEVLIYDTTLRGKLSSLLYKIHYLNNHPANYYYFTIP